MSTNSMIGRVNSDGRIDAIYCHWDGYPEHNGKILLQHYTDPSKIDELINLGDLSVLDVEIGNPSLENPHSYQSPHDGWCIAYHRDRGELHHWWKDIPMDQFTAVAFGCGAAYAYLWWNDEWMYAPITMGGMADWRPLSQANLPLGGDTWTMS